MRSRPTCRSSLCNCSGAPESSGGYSAIHTCEPSLPTTNPFGFIAFSWPQPAIYNGIHFQKKKIRMYHQSLLIGVYRKGGVSDETPRLVNVINILRNKHFTDHRFHCPVDPAAHAGRAQTCACGLPRLRDRGGYSTLQYSSNSLAFSFSRCFASAVM